MSDLLSACECPIHLAVAKIKAHCSPDSDEAQGNAMVDAAAKVASSFPFVTISGIKTSDSDAVKSDTQETWSSLMDMYANVTALEVWSWVDKV